MAKEGFKTTEMPKHSAEPLREKLLIEKVPRTKFENSQDLKIREWAEKVTANAGENLQNAKVNAIVTVEDPAKWKENERIKEKMKEELVFLGVREENIDIELQPLTLENLGGMIDNSNWRHVQASLSEARNSNNEDFLASRILDAGKLGAIVNAKSFWEFQNALFSFGNEQIFFPQEQKDAVISGFYERLRNTSVSRRGNDLSEKLTYAQLVKGEAPEQNAFRRNGQEPISQMRQMPLSPMPDIVQKKIRVPSYWLDAGVKGSFTPKLASDMPQGSILYPNIDIPKMDGSMDIKNFKALNKEQADAINYAANMNHFLGILEPLWGPGQAMQIVDAFKSGNAGGVLRDAYMGRYAHKALEYLWETEDILFDNAKQLWVGKKEDDWGLKIFASLPVWPIRGELPLSHMGFSIYNATSLGAEGFKDWVLINEGKKNLKASVELGFGGIFSNKKLYGSPPTYKGNWYKDLREIPQIFNPLAEENDLGIGMSAFSNNPTMEKLDANIPLAKCNGRLEFEMVSENKVKVNANLNMRFLSLAAGYFPTTTLDGSIMKNIAFEGIGNIEAGLRAGINVSALDMSRAGAFVRLEAENKLLPAFTFSYDWAKPLKGEIQNYGAGIEGKIDVQKDFEVQSNWLKGIGYALQWGRTAFPYGGQSVDNVTLTFSLEGIVPVAWEEK